jgi:uncharacterized protein
MSKRLRDPVHGLIVFDDGDLLQVDPLAWALIDTSEFQRLRRIRQLGVSEFTFPSAVHTRFAHSIGVFHTARMLVNVIKREMSRNGQPFEEPKAKVALVAALLHDLGHGPFSHTFEEVQESRNVKKRHEKWTADIVRNPDGGIRPCLERFELGFTEKVAQLLEKEDPEDIYHAVVSSSFDGDRLDYLQRDRLMTGIGAGAIDFDWLIENVRVADVDLNAPGDSDGDAKAPTFCLEKKALPAAEQFLLARYTLHQQVYFHKATRCVEHMIGKLLRAVAAHAAKRSSWPLTGLTAEHPLLRFFKRDGDTVANYLALDDALITGSLDALSRAEDPIISDTASRLRNRQLYKTLDLAEFGEDQGTQRGRLRRIREAFADKIKSEDVMIDDRASIGIYTEIGGDEERMHKKLHVLDGRVPKEISKRELSPLIEALATKKQFTRVYFRDAADRDTARR